MTHGNGVSRGDRNRNARLARLREVVRPEHAIVGIDLADKKLMVVVCDHDSKVLARRTFRCKAWALGAALDWAAQHQGDTTRTWAGPHLIDQMLDKMWRLLSQEFARRGQSPRP